MHIDVSARPNTRYTIVAIMYIVCCKYTEQSITVCLLFEIVFLNMTKSVRYSSQCDVWQHIRCPVLWSTCVPLVTASPVLLHEFRNGLKVVHARKLSDIMTMGDSISTQCELAASRMMTVHFASVPLVSYVKAVIPVYTVKKNPASL